MASRHHLFWSIYFKEASSSRSLGKEHPVPGFSVQLEFTRMKLNEKLPRSSPSALVGLKGFRGTELDWRRESEVKNPETSIFSTDVRASALGALPYKPTPMCYFLIQARWLQALWVLGSSQIWLQLCPDPKKHWLCFGACFHINETWVNKVPGSPQTCHQVPCSPGPCSPPPLKVSHWSV